MFRDGKLIKCLTKSSNSKYILFCGRWWHDNRQINLRLILSAQHTQVTTTTTTTTTIETITATTTATTTTTTLPAHTHRHTTQYETTRVVTINAPFCLQKDVNHASKEGGFFVNNGILVLRDDIMMISIYEGETFRTNGWRIQ